MAKQFQYYVDFHEDGDCTVLARVCARNGSGAATGVSGEGNYLQQADVSAIVYSAFDLDGSTPSTAITGYSAKPVTVADAILDTVVTANTIWKDTTAGYNFIHDLPAAIFAVGGRRYEIEYKFTLTGGEVFHVVVTGNAKPIRTS